jgi:protein-serine/threonine kinase
MSLKRELEIMQTIRHPSLVHLKAWNIEPTRAILVLSYCPGGDLFDVASSHREALTPSLLRRIFAELVGAVRYLHERRIVHRDIKLENVLVNLPPGELLRPALLARQQDAPDDDDDYWQTYPYSVVTLTDLGLSRRIADNERLETRCGSDDYAAPEVIMGQPYDGRATDAWSLGVLLYALLEARLPFDPHPVMAASTTAAGLSFSAASSSAAAASHEAAVRMRSRASHRIARVEWRWIEYAGDDGDHEADVALFERRRLRGAMDIAEGLLKRARSRWPLEKVAGQEWVAGGIRIPGGGGVRFRDEEEGEEVL